MRYITYGMIWMIWYDTCGAFFPQWKVFLYFCIFISGVVLCVFVSQFKYVLAPAHGGKVCQVCDIYNCKKSVTIKAWWECFVLFWLVRVSPSHIRTYEVSTSCSQSYTSDLELLPFWRCVVRRSHPPRGTSPWHHHQQLHKRKLPSMPFMDAVNS